jgi:hypothetical protein
MLDARIRDSLRKGKVKILHAVRVTNEELGEEHSDA